MDAGSKIFKVKAEEIIFNDIKDSLIKLGIKFDQFTNEKTFYENGDIDKLMNELRKKDLIYKKENAATTVASTITIASKFGIKFFATVFVFHCSSINCLALAPPVNQGKIKGKSKG